MQEIDAIFNNEALKILILSMLPVTELRLSIPYGINFYSISVYYIVLISIVGNIFIGVLVLYIIGPLMFVLKKITIFNTIISYIFSKTISKSNVIEKRKLYGLVIFVSIPLPLTGVWTGALAAYLLNLSREKSILAIIAGVLVSSSIVTTLTLLSIKIF